MIAALIRWSARNVFLVGLATIFVTLAESTPCRACRSMRSRTSRTFR